MPSAKHIVVATDLRPGSEVASRFAADLANTLGAKLTVLHVFEVPYPYPVPWPPEHRQNLLEKLDDQCAALRTTVPEATACLREGDPRREILSFAAEAGADLIVVGTHGRHGPPRLLLGSVAEKVIRFSPVPVIAVPSRRAVTPKDLDADA